MRPPLNWDPENVKSLPSPEQLKYKILVKGKTIKTFSVDEVPDEESGKFPSPT